MPIYSHTRLEEFIRAARDGHAAVVAHLVAAGGVDVNHIKVGKGKGSSWATISIKIPKLVCALMPPPPLSVYSTAKAQDND